MLPSLIEPLLLLCFTVFHFQYVRSQGSNAESIGQLIKQIEQGGVSLHSDSIQISSSLDSSSRNVQRGLNLFQSRDYDSSERQTTPTHHSAWMNSGLFQGDIAGIDPKYAFNSDAIQYNAIRNRKLRWPNGVVPYKISNNFTPSEKQVILRAMSTYRKKTCIKFTPRSSEFDYLNFVKSYGCYSQVGRTGGRQDLSLGLGCLFHEIAVHEMMHALGFWHEHSRADRDQYINIQWSNVIPGMRGQFDKISQAYQDFLGQSYDYTSVMHYDSKAFSRNGRNTIVAQQSAFTNVIGGAKDLSDKDLLKVNTLYECPKVNTGSRPNPRPLITTPRPIVKQPTTRLPAPLPPPEKDCKDKFLDCPFFYRYCFKQSFQFIMQLYCPNTCNTCDKKPRNSNPKFAKSSSDIFHRSPFQRSNRFSSRNLDDHSSFFQRALHSVFGT